MQAVEAGACGGLVGGVSMIVWVPVGGLELWSGDNTIVEFVVVFVVAFVVVDISCIAQRTFFNSCGGGGFIEGACG